MFRACLFAMLLAAGADPWEPARFLIGKWEGEAQGQPGKGASVREYRWALDNRYIEVRNKSTYPSETHEDWGMISYDRSRKKLVLRQFHVEGFVNQYVQDDAAGVDLRFTTEAIENIPPGFRARETYRRTSADTFTERFELAEPGKDFDLYTETRFKRAK